MFISVDIDILNRKKSLIFGNKLKQNLKLNKILIMLKKTTRLCLLAGTLSVLFVLQFVKITPNINYDPDEFKTTVSCVYL